MRFPHVRGAMNCATTNGFFGNEKRLFRKGIMLMETNSSESGFVGLWCFCVLIAKISDSTDCADFLVGKSEAFAPAGRNLCRKITCTKNKAPAGRNLCRNVYPITIEPHRGDICIIVFTLCHHHHADRKRTFHHNPH